MAISDMCEAYGAKPWEVVPDPQRGPEWWLPRWHRLRARRLEIANQPPPPESWDDE